MYFVFCFCVPHGGLATSQGTYLMMLINFSPMSSHLFRGLHCLVSNGMLS